jgi:NAD(P)H dehydrogenase (quinone)
MRVHVLFAHPLTDSYVAALHKTIIDALVRAGHEVDDCDLYAEEFSPSRPFAARKRRHRITIAGAK